MRLQDILIPVQIPSTANTRAHRFSRNTQKADQQDQVRRYLDMMAVRPQIEAPGKCSKIFVHVTMIRVARGRLDQEDNLPTAFKAIRDTIARWVHGLDETVPRMKDGLPVIVKGKLKMTRPHAPDGRKDGIAWAYQQQRTRAPRHSARILIEQVELPATTLTLIE